MLFNKENKELNRLQQELDIAKAKQAALLVERDFWVEQGRTLQNTLSNYQRMYAGLYDQLGRGVVTDVSLKENLALAAEQLRQPLTTVEAIRAYTASIEGATQGAYTSVDTDTAKCVKEIHSV